MLGPHPGKNNYTQENLCQEGLIEVIITKVTDDNANILHTKSTEHIYIVTVEAVRRP